MSLLTVSSRPRWTGLDRSASIDAAISVQINRGWYLNWFSPRMAWVARDPALASLHHARNEVQRVFESRLDDLFTGVTTLPGWSLEVTMYGRTAEDAQPTLICSSLQSRCRSNAKKIISQERIIVDQRGIGLEFHHDPVIFYGGVRSSWLRTKKFGSDMKFGGAFSKPFVIEVGGISCTSGCFVRIAGRLYCMTVAHAFEHPVMCGDALSSFDVISNDGNSRTKECGVLWEKRSFDKRHSHTDYDWALCALDDDCPVSPRPLEVSKSLSARVAPTLEVGTPVLVSTVSNGTIDGKVISTDALVMLPGGRKFQRMCRLQTTKQLNVGDSGSAIYDAVTGDLCGFIIAGKTSTNQAYFYSAYKVFGDIEQQLGADIEVLQIPTKDQTELEKPIHKDRNFDRGKGLFRSVFGSKSRVFDWSLGTVVLFFGILAMLQGWYQALAFRSRSISLFEDPLLHTWQETSDIWNMTMTSGINDWRSNDFAASCVMPLNVTVNIDNKSSASNTYLNLAYGFSSFDPKHLNSLACVGWASRFEDYNLWNLSSRMNLQPAATTRSFMLEEEHMTTTYDSYLRFSELSIFDMDYLEWRPYEVSGSKSTAIADPVSGFIHYAFTYFVLAWLLIRINIQPMKKNDARIFAKIKWMAASVLVPEAVFWLAWQQFSEAVALKKILNRTASSDIEATGDKKAPWTLTHAYYVCMGGLVVGSSEHGLRTLSTDAVVYLSSLSRDLTEIPDITVEEIAGKSKADLVATSVILVQLIWETARTLYHAWLTGHLDVTGLMQFIYSLYAVLLYMIWFKKPKDVSQPTTVTSGSAIALAALNKLFERPQSKPLTRWPRAHIEADFIRAEQFIDLIEPRGWRSKQETRRVYCHAISLSCSLGYWHPLNCDSTVCIPRDKERDRVSLAWQAWSNIKALPLARRRKLATQAIIRRTLNVPDFAWSIEYWLRAERVSHLLAYLACYFMLWTVALEDARFSSTTEQYIWKRSIEVQAALVVVTYLLAVIREYCRIWPHLLTTRHKRWMLSIGLGLFIAARLVFLYVPFVSTVTNWHHIGGDPAWR